MTNKESPKCQICGSTNIVYVEYDYTCPERHDGWSEIDCMECRKRFDRWRSGLELKGAELEKKSARFKTLEIEKNGKIYEYDREGFQPID